MKKALALFCSFFIFYNASAQTQPQKNYELIENLIRESVENIKSESSENIKEYSLKILLPSALENLKPAVINAFINKGIGKAETDSNNSINYILENASVVYGESFRDGFFGEINTRREIIITGNHFLETTSGYTKAQKFNLTFSDTIEVDSIPEIETKTLPFTCGEIPEAPVLSNLAEPIIVVGALIVTVILFFTVRGN